MSGQRVAFVAAGVIIAAAAVAGVGYWIGTKHNNHLPASAVLVAPAGQTTTTTTQPPDTTTTSVGSPLTISVEPSSSSGPVSSILLPASCVLSGDTVTASGTFNGGFAPEEYTRVGAVVELYVYASATSADSQGLQIADLNGGEQPSAIYKDPNSWTVSAKVDPSNGAPATCVVAVQPTHDFMGAGNVGG